MQCHDFREIADSYLSDELLVETNHDVISHLQACADCRRELAARRELRRKLRDGFQRAPDLQISDDFASRLKAELRDVALRRSRLSATNRVAYLAIAASLVIAATLGLIAVQQGWRSRNPPTTISGTNLESNTEPGRNGSRAPLVSAALIETAVGDHRDCALDYRLEEEPIALEEAGRKYDRAYINLVSAVMSGVLPPGVELAEAHSCVFKGQRFAHVILKYHDHQVSVLVTNIETQDHGGTARPEELIASAQSDGFQIAHFATERHAIFVVSGLSDTENGSIARAIAPSLSRHIRQAERTA